MKAAPKLRLLRGTGATQWVSTALETTRPDGLVMRAEKCPAPSQFAGEWEALLDVPLPTEDNRWRRARLYVPGLFSNPDAAMDAAERCAARLGDVRGVLAFLSAAPRLLLWWAHREPAEPLPFGCAECGGDCESCTCSVDGPRERGLS